MEKSSFQFAGYKIVRSLIHINKNDFKDYFEINFEPHGTINIEESKFSLLLKIFINNKDHSIIIELDVQSEFTFQGYESQEKLSNYFYTNTTAIIFPYIRAYISALTTLSGNGTINLPLLNLTALGEIVQKNTVILPKS